MTQKPGKGYREGISIFELQRMFPDEASARAWFEELMWPGGSRYCPQCGSENTYECKHAKSPYRCRDCKKYISVKTGTVMAGSPLPLLKWLYAIYLDATSLKGVSSMKLHRDLGITQKAAWFMQQRIREAFAEQGASTFGGPVEADETYMGGLEKNKHAKDKLKIGRGAVGKTAVVGVKDRETKIVAATVVSETDKQTIQGFVKSLTAQGASVYTDEAKVYKGLVNHSSVRHSAGEYVDGDVHTNGMESFWSMLKRAHKGTFHKISPKHMHRYVAEFVGRHNIRELDTIQQMEVIGMKMVGNRLTYEELTRDTGLSSGARV